MTLGQGLVRDRDDVLVWQGGRHYEDPGEAVKTWWAGQTRIGCSHSVYADYATRPCGKKASYDPDANGRPTKCGTHSKAGIAKRKAKQDARYAEWLAKSKRRDAITKASRELEPALRKIAEGHNDARGLAQEIIAALDAARSTT